MGCSFSVRRGTTLSKKICRWRCFTFVFTIFTVLHRRRSPCSTNRLLQTWAVACSFLEACSNLLFFQRADWTLNTPVFADHPHVKEATVKHHCAPAIYSSLLNIYTADELLNARFHQKSLRLLNTFRKRSSREWNCIWQCWDIFIVQIVYCSIWEDW